MLLLTERSLTIMPRGLHLSKTHLGLIWHHRVVLERSPAQIFSDIFQNDAGQVSFDYINRLCRACDSNLEVARFQGVRAQRSGGPHTIVDVVAEGFFLNIFRREMGVILIKARESFLTDYYGVEIGGPSIRTMGRILKKSNFSRKVMQRVHYLRCPIKRAEYMERAGPFHFSRFVDIDETLSTWKEFQQRYGFSMRGDVALRTQFRINGRHYSSVCAYAAIGLIAYRVVEGSINSEIFQSFLENEVAAALVPGMVGLFDNAAIHHTALVRASIENVFNGMYLYAAPYSPDLKPVERLFAVVKDLLRYREDEAVLNPIGIISEIFETFRPGCIKSQMAVNHFRLYRDNHNMWLFRNDI